MKRLLQMGCRLITAAGILAIAALLVTGCGSGESSTGSITDTDLTLPVPARIRDISAINPANVIATAIVNGVPVTLQRNNTGSYSGAIQVPAQSTFAVEIEFSEQFADQNLKLATRTQQVITGTTNQQLNLRRAGYNFALHDADGDSVSNIVEREENTNPLDGSDSPPMINVSMIAERPAALNSGSVNQFLFEGSVGSDAKPLNASGSNFTANFFVVDRTPLNASVQIIETVTEEQLAVATQSRQLNTVVDQQSIVFESGVYSTTDIDRDGQSDLAELIAGTGINDASDPPPATTVALTAQFNSPSLIQSPQGIFAEYRLNNQLITLTRTLNSFAATSNVTPGSMVNLEVTLLDNFNDQPFVLARAQKPATIGSTAQTISFIESDFVFNFDNDNDGSFNYQERELGTDPFNPPVVIPPTPVSCNVRPLPVTVDGPGQWVTISNVSSYIDCGDESYALNGSLFNFTWSSEADSIGWLIPEDSTDGEIFSYQIEIVDPEIATNVYATLVVNTRVEASSCTVGTRIVRIDATEDIFFQNNRTFNNEELRVNGSNRRALIGFDVPSQQGELTAAVLTVTVGDDRGNGVVGVYQNDAYQWSETAIGLVPPPLTNLIGSRNGLWLTDTSYRIGLDSLFVSEPRVNLFLQQEPGSNDVNFTSRETNSPSVLELEYTGCF